MYERAVALDPKFALAFAAIAIVCAQYQSLYGSNENLLDRAQEASRRATELQPAQPEVQVAQGWVHYALNKLDAAETMARMAIDRKPDCEGAYALLLRVLFAAGSYQEVADITEVALESAGQDYNVYIPVINALRALGKTDALNNVRQRYIETLEKHLQHVPEDVRARVLLSAYYSQLGRVEDATREVNLAMELRPDEGSVLYNAACTFCNLNRKAEALDALAKAHDAGMTDSVWAWRDPDLTILHGDPEFERLYPEPPTEREDPR